MTASGSGEAGQLPQPQRHQRQREEQRQRDAAEIVDQLLRQPEQAGHIVDVADDRGDQHRADVGRQRERPAAEAGQEVGPAHVALDPGRDQPPIHIATRMTTSVLSSPYASTSSPAGALGAGSARRCLRRRARRPPARMALATAAVWRSLPSLDDGGPDRAANEAAGDDADHRRGDRERGGAGYARRSNSGANARPVAGPPVSVTDPASTPISGCWPSGLRRHGADDVLDHGDHRREQEEEHHLRPADPQQRQAGAEADGREERDHQRRLQGRVEGDERPSRPRGHGDQQRHQQPADDRRRQVVARQQRHERADAVADEQDDAGEREGLDEIEGHAASGWASGSRAAPGPVMALGYIAPSHNQGAEHGQRSIRARRPAPTTPPRSTPSSPAGSASSTRRWSSSAR